MSTRRQPAKPQPAPERPLEVRLRLAAADDPIARRRLVEALARLLFDGPEVE